MLPKMMQCASDILSKYGFAGVFFNLQFFVRRFAGCLGDSGLLEKSSRADYAKCLFLFLSTTKTTAATATAATTAPITR